MKEIYTKSNGIKIVQNVQLVCLDSNVDVSSADYRDIISQLRKIVNTVHVFTDREECIQFILTTTDNKLCIITSSSLARLIMLRIHNIPQVDSIFISCDSKKEHHKWMKEWSKIKGIFTDISPICDALKQASQQCEQNSISISFIPMHDDASIKNVDSTFLCTKIIKEILLTTQFDPQNFKKFIDYCRDTFEGNKDELANINAFERNYRKERAIGWYTLKNFLYPMLNRALRIMDVSLIIKMGFFIIDLHHHIEKLHNEQFIDRQTRKTFTVYRGQSLTKINFEQMKNSQGGLICFNNILCTTKERNASLPFVNNALTDPDARGILFVITVEPSKSTIPFASIEKDEVLFSTHAVFRIHGIKPINENHRLFQVGLILMGEDDKDYCALNNYIREESFLDANGWYRLGCVLLKTGQSKNAQYVYEILLEQATDESEKAYIYHRLGWIKYDQKQYNEAIIFYGKALEIYTKTLPSTHINLMNVYNNIALVYNNMKEYSKALSYYEKVLEIQKQSSSSSHTDLITSYNNIGKMHYNIGEYSQALLFYEKTLALQQQLLPSNHPDLAATYNNIGETCRNMGKYSKALLSHETTLEIQFKSLRHNHPDLAFSYNNIGNIYYNMNEYTKALSYYEKTLEIRQQSLPSTHPDFAASFNNMGIIYRTIGEYSKALSFQKKAFQIRQQTLSPNHLDLVASYINLGKVYYDMGSYPNALLCHEKALEIQRHSLSFNHPELAMSYAHLSNVYSTMGNYSKAISFCQYAINIAERSLPSDHPYLQWYKNTLHKLKTNYDMV